MTSKGEVFIEPGTVINNYIFNEQIGSGGYAAVYVVTSIKFRTKFVAKVLLPCDNDISHAWKSFDTEVSNLLKLDFPHIIRMYEYFAESNRFFIILEYCSNGSLFDYVNTYGPLSGHKLINITHQLVSAVQYAHSNCIAHRDIKPHNILMDEFGRIKLADFGISIFLANEPNCFNFKCSPAFAAPEILSKQPHNSYKADMWSVGVTIYFIATGQYPFHSTKIDKLLNEMKEIGVCLNKYHYHPLIYTLLLKTIQYNPQNRISIDEAFDIIKRCSEETTIRKISSSVSSKMLLPKHSAEKLLAFHLGRRKLSFDKSKATFPPQKLGSS
ncbi:CAMK family protein kinase [Tritrichomonas foetus]|uniref:CAMK family protein kinase n=1 Tax=Tritrichomonas foetus TaxID=1144522 RepID=A0A1J4J9X7_9EUKA|nr:CAMK family protein kinase [Tritrichomonas foetus]|eukprot:OHS95994.1 CAMK family protein kinase [Tritrichomonas foetus]